jgi:hypothetical protein
MHSETEKVCRWLGRLIDLLESVLHINQSQEFFHRCHRSTMQPPTALRPETRGEEEEEEEEGALV